MTEHRPPTVVVVSVRLLTFSLVSFHATMDFPQRKRPARQPVYRVDQRSIILFVTVCTAKRKPILTQPDILSLLRQAWTGGDHWAVGPFVIMPDHIHLFCAPARLDHLPVKRWIAFWKSRASRTWPRPNEHPIWQPDGWDTQLRRGESYAAKWAYVRENPVRKGLVEHADDWPYAGECTRLPWHD